MKKKYVKPGIIIEDFVLAQNISGGCGAVPGGNTLGKPTHWDNTTNCGWDLNDGSNYIIWVKQIGSTCTSDWPADVPYDGICYNNPQGGNSIFNS